MQINNSIGLGVKIKLEREKQGLSQSKLADMACVSRTFVYEVERGKASVELGKVFKLIQVLKMHLSLHSKPPADPLGDVRVALEGLPSFGRMADTDVKVKSLPGGKPQQLPPGLIDNIVEGNRK